MDPDGRDAAFFIELVYKLPGLDDTDALRQKARKQADLLVGDLSIRIVDEVLDKAVWKRIAKIMPTAAPDLFARGIVPKIDMPMKLELVNIAPVANTRKCLRCYEVLTNSADEANDTRLCRRCVINGYFRLDIIAPWNTHMGANMVLWRCRRCGLRWNAEGVRTKAAAMNGCLACLRPETNKRKLRSERAPRIEVSAASSNRRGTSEGNIEMIVGAPSGI
jgi:hypothetical protein